jgi:hypothetical protein
LDANLVYACVVNLGPQTDLAARLIGGGGVCYFSALADYETRKALFTHGGTDAQFDYLSELVGRRFTLNAGWDTAAQRALRLAADFRKRLAVDSADTLHVAWALMLGADTFASFDRDKGPRSLALAVGLKVYPAPSPKDYEQMKRLKP